MTRARTRVLCVDDHAFVAEGLQARLEREPDLEFVGHRDRADDLVEAARSSRADIVLLDLDMPGAEPIDALVDLVRECPKVRAIVLSAFVRDHYIDAAFEAGAWGYLTKKDAPAEVIDGIRRVVDGNLAVSDEVMSRSQPKSRPRRRLETEPIRSKLELLTRREIQILRMIARGMSRQEIARQVSRSPMTIDNHRKSIMRKLGIHERAELIRYGIAEGLAEV